MIRKTIQRAFCENQCRPVRNLSNSQPSSFTIATAAKRIRDGSLSSRELVASLLQRIEETEPTIKAYLTVQKEESLRVAEAADKQIRSGYDLGLLHGIPISVKDLIETRNIRTTAGSKLFADYVPNEDATVVKRLKAAGAIILGKTNTHEFALGGITPPTRNPWDLSRIPGGSSGGSAAAVAASSALGALGSDTGGSIRIPASYCGVVGLKPTYGRVSRAGVFPESWSLDHVGPLTKTVEDCAIVLNAISGYDERDETTLRQPTPDFTSSLDKDVTQLKIGLPENHFFERIDEEVRTSVREAVKIFEKLGASVTYIKFPMIPEIMGAYAAIDYAEVSAYHERFYNQRAEDYQPDVRAFIELGFFIPVTLYLNAQRVRGAIMRQVLKLFDEVDAIVTPTVPTTAPKCGTEKVTLGGVEEDLLFAMCRYLAPFNLTGLPAISICSGFSSENLPIGMQIVGPLYDESTVLQLANSYDKETKLYRRHPRFS